ncbi:MAG: RnfH family protein [Candidatus Competibacteraceae bacterium]|nr:RnfH family protein [Candidatus Competibacteraceae bacterium]
MQVSVAYVEPGQPLCLNVEVPDGSTVQQAIELSGILTRCPHLNLKKQKIGIYGKLTKLTAPLEAGDRVEIYRPITVDPKKIPQRKIASQDDDEDDDD